MNEMRGQLKNEAVRAYLFAGNATITVVSRKTGTRFTFKVQAPDKTRDGQPLKPEAAQIHFVKVLTGSDNTGDFTYLGNIFNRRDYTHGRKSRIARTAPSAVAFEWFFSRLDNLAGVDVYHEGSCGRCGRKLTVPESVATGYGPECAGRLEIAYGRVREGDEGVPEMPRWSAGEPSPAADRLGPTGHYHAPGDRFDSFTEPGVNLAGYGPDEVERTYGQPVSPDEPVSQSNPIIRPANYKKGKPAPKPKAEVAWLNSFDKNLGF